MIVFDLDGTLADCEHRRHFVDSSKLGTREDYEKWIKPFVDSKTCPEWKPDWKAFYEACDQDEVIKITVEVLHHCFACEREVQIWSGRCESVREKTEKWLLDNIEMKYCTAFNPKKHLKMRPIGDSTPDDILKEKWLDETLAQGKTIGCVFDDRPKVIRMWRRRGIFVFNCCQHDEEF